MPVDNIDDLERDAFDQAVLHTMDSARDAVMMFDPETLGFIYVNQGAVDQLGYFRGEFMEMSPLDVCPEFTEGSFRDALASPCRRGCVTRVFNPASRQGRP